ncbi:glycosyltransferase [Streptomyces sp. CB01881]|uniref:glycosyltransferase n=1 Tax=Streptomyces sp. CB01881 TaxID=2078691 RepID=UPI000CDC204A|nr:glycosyltransferase [Streptomyces sp. CB01881]AUY47874.1 hypothetical protein C2142_01600 [Streptomyces sp. CB01881]TYC76348.1 glycosyltransferase [Streptomyces sp. CB01881]
MGVQQLQNPYDYRSPVRSEELFAGRAAELGRIDYELGQARVDRPIGYVAVYGMRGAGKTSLLNITELLARERGVLPVRVELLPGDATLASFYRKVYEELVTALALEGVFDRDGLVTPVAVRRVFAGATPPDDFPLEFPEALALAGTGGAPSEAALRADLGYFVRTLGRPIALLIDEAQLIAENGDVLSSLRSLGTRIAGYVVLLAGTSGLVDQINEVFSPLSRQFAHIEVKRFLEFEEIRDCILRPLRSVGLDARCFEHFQATVSELRRLTDGNPYGIQLYCHEMFARWQTGSATTMELTTEMLEDVRSRMEQGKNVLDRPLVRLVRGMSLERLEVFNVLCSALGQATADEVWFARELLGRPTITREAFDAHHRELVDTGVLRDAERVALSEDAELFDLIYVRLWTLNRLGQHELPQIMSADGYPTLLTWRLECLLAQFAAEPAHRLPTCCPGMPQATVDRAKRALEVLSADGPEPVPHGVQFLHRAILASGRPSTLDITTVTCSYRGTAVVRWLCSAGDSAFDLEGATGFQAAVERVAGLGGELSAELTRWPLRSWSDIAEWLRLSVGHTRADLADNYFHAFYLHYGQGDRSSAWELLVAAYELKPTSKIANNLCYLSLLEGEAAVAAEWAQKAVDGAEERMTRALARYNGAMAYLVQGDLESAQVWLLAGAADIGPTIGGFETLYLLVPTADGAGVTLREQVGLNLADAFDAPLALTGYRRGSEVLVVEEPPAEPQAEHHVPTVLAVATEWSSAHGGLSTFNRRMCRALAAAGAKVYCTVLHADQGEMARAKAAGVELLPAENVPGRSEEARLSRRPELPEGVTPDLVIGHGRITGDAAEAIVAGFYKRARRLHFIHMAPDEIEWHKPDRTSDRALVAEERTDVERRLGVSAHRVVTVGKRLHYRFVNELGAGVPEPLLIVPGFDVDDDSPRTPPGGLVRVLMVGRTEDWDLKGLDLAARACGQVTKWREKAGRDRISLLVRGAPAERADEQRDQIRAWAGDPRLEVVVRPYSPDQERLAGDMGRASLVIMPSRKEGFGLVGVEAITSGVPVLISRESGLADLLHDRLGREMAGRLLVPMSGDDDEDADTWAREIDKVLADLPSAFRLAAEVRTTLSAQVPWSLAAGALLAEAETVQTAE